MSLFNSFLKTMSLVTILGGLVGKEGWLFLAGLISFFVWDSNILGRKFAKERREGDQAKNYELTEEDFKKYNSKELIAKKRVLMDKEKFAKEKKVAHDSSQ